MPVKAAIGVICVLTAGIGYLAFGGAGLAAGLLPGILIHADRYLKQRPGGLRTAGSSLFRLGRKASKRAAARHSARLETLLAKAHLLAETFHDVYGARNCCLEIIRQTDKEDPLFIAAYDLFMRTVTMPPIRPPARPGQDVPTPPRADSLIELRDKADIIAFPPPLPRR